MVSVIPFDIIMSVGGYNKVSRFARVGKLYKLVKMAKLGRLMRIIKMKSNLVSQLVNVLKISAGLERLLMLFVVFFVS